MEIPAPALVDLKIPRVLIVDAAVTANAVQFPSILTIPADGDFEWWWLAASRTSPLLKVLIKEVGTGQQDLIISGSPQGSTAFNGILIDNLAGLVQANAEFPIAVPYVMPASRVYQHLFTDTSGATNTVQLAYHGFKLSKVRPQ